MDWLLSRDGLVRTAERALDVGCGLGYNAEALSARGFDVTAFDISRAAVETCRRRVPETKVDYVQGDLRKPESSWTGRFDLVFEAAVLQVMRLEEVERGVRNLCSFVAPGGLLLTITRLRDPSQPQTCMPWHFTLDELTTIPRLEGLEFADFVEVPDPINHAVRRARLTFRRRASA
jgi:2-polyprenyl-3-methyl-5-hydroxy-6-metoxy-1,4-benzoquinol methylase